MGGVGDEIDLVVAGHHELIVYLFDSAIRDMVAKRIEVLVGVVGLGEVVTSELITVWVGRLPRAQVSDRVTVDHLRAVSVLGGVPHAVAHQPNPPSPRRAGWVNQANISSRISSSSGPRTRARAWPASPDLRRGGPRAAASRNRRCFDASGFHGSAARCSLTRSS